MRALLTSILLISTTFIALLWVKPYFSSAKNSSVSAVTTNSPASVVTKNSSASVVENSSPSTAIAHYVVKKSSKVADVDVNKLISVASSEGLKPKALKAALNAYSWALHHGKLGSNKNTLTVVDFTLPSYRKRMWVLNLHQNKVLMKLHTTQGAGSGLLYASRFSNKNNTQATSIGLYVTSNEYYGGHGKSMRLDGLQKGVNDNARRRNIVIHEAPYASPEYIKMNHRAGRSWGCFAIAPSSKKALLGYVKGGSAFFAYAQAIEKNTIVSNGPISI